MEREGLLGEPFVNVDICSFPFGSQYNCKGVYIHCMYGFDVLLWDAIRLENLEHFVPIYGVKGFLEVDEHNGSFFLVVSHFLDDASKRKNLRRYRSWGSKSVLV